MSRPHENTMNPIQVICADAAAKAAVEKRLQSEGLPVETPRPAEAPARGEITVLCTPAALNAVVALDETLIGTADYMGLAFFWAYEYRHYLRDCTQPARCRVHDRLLADGLALDGESARHLQIITEEMESQRANQTASSLVEQIFDCLEKNHPSAFWNAITPFR